MYNLQINILVKEGHLRYSNGFVSSNSDFWHDPTRKDSFGAVCANMTMKHYQFRNGLILAISDTTLAKMRESGEADDLLVTQAPILMRGTALLDFCRVEEKKTGEFLGRWLSERHTNHGIIMDYIGSHVVDSAANAVSSVEHLKFASEGGRSHDIVAERCDAHKANTASGEASGTSLHKINLHPRAGETMKKLHSALSRVHRSKQRRDVLNAVHQEHLRTKVPRLQPHVVTRWRSRLKEAAAGNALQRDFNVALGKMICEGGCDEDLLKEHTKQGTVDSLFIQPQDWDFLLQYEGAMKPMDRFIVFAQSAKTVVHWELFESARTLEELNLPFFITCANTSKRTGKNFAADLTIREMSICVMDKDFMFDMIDEEKEDYQSKYSSLTPVVQLPDIALVRRIASRKFSKRVRFYS